MSLGWAILVIVAVALGLGLVQTVGAQESGPTIGPVPDVGDRSLTKNDLPDLIPLVDNAGEIVGYLRSDELYVELFHPTREFVAAGVYESDGETLIGYEIPGRGFVETTTPSATSRPQGVPAAGPRLELRNPFPS